MPRLGTAEPWPATRGGYLLPVSPPEPVDSGAQPLSAALPVLRRDGVRMIEYRFRPLFDGASAGYYTLPGDLAAGLDLVRKLEERQAERPDVAAPAAREALTDAILAAVQADKPLPSASGYLKALEADRAAQERATVYAEVLEARTARLETRLSASAATIVADHLVPALAEVLEEARVPADVIQPFGTDPAGLIHAPDDVRAAHGVLSDLAARYSAIRAARNVFRVELKPEMDGNSLFGELRNFTDVHPNYRSTQAPKPWPADPVGRLVWLVTSGAQPWCPTPEQQDERWMEVFGDAVKARAAQAAAARMFGARTAEVA